MQTSENAAMEHKFIGYVINENHQTSCMLTNSLKNVQYLLAQNTFRTTPTTGRQMINYRDGMLSRFQDNMKRSCIRQGKFPASFVKRNFTVSEPRIENCAASCFFMSTNFLEASKHNSISMVKQKATNCQAWSFNIKTGICEWIEEISNEEFIEKIDWETNGNIYAMSGLSTCQPIDFYKSVPKIFANGDLVDLQRMCNFSSVNLVFENQLARCKNLYYKLQSPIEKQRAELSMFVANLIKQHKIKKSRTIRSVMNTGLQIAKILLNAANTLESSVLRNVIDTVTRTSVGLLHSLSQKITAAGIQNKVVYNTKEEAVSFHTLDIEQFLRVAKSWQTNYNQLQLIKHNYDVFIDQLSTSSHNLEKYFLELFSNELPIKQSTVNFIKNQTYIFSSYINGDKIVRQFIKTQTSSYSALQSTLIPIKQDTFFQSYFWQSDLFKGKNFKRSNQCLILLMQSVHNEHTVEVCKAAPKLAELEKVEENVYSIKQQLKNVAGRIVVANAAAVYEIRCKQGQLVKSTQGLAIFMISNDCSFTMSGQIIIQPAPTVAGFRPKFLFSLNSTLSKPKKVTIDWHKIGNSITTGIICAIGAIIFMIVCIKCSYTRTNVQYNYVAPTEQELEKL